MPFLSNETVRFKICLNERDKSKLFSVINFIRKQDALDLK